MPSFDIGHRIAIYAQKRNLEPDDVFKIMSDLWWSCDFAANKHRNVEQLLYHPIDAIRYCIEVRAATSYAIPDEEILQTLNNLRKNKFLEANRPVTSEH